MDPVMSVKVSITRIVSSSALDGCAMVYSPRRYGTARCLRVLVPDHVPQRETAPSGAASVGVRRSLLLGEVVVGHERVWREVGPLVGHHQRGVRALAVVHLLEEGVLLALGFGQLVPLL